MKMDILDILNSYSDKQVGKIVKPKGTDIILAFTARGEFESWLEEHHAAVDQVWLQFARKGTSVTTITYEEAVLVGLCYGWIDGQAASQDETYWLQRFTPRRATSRWSKINRERAERLIAEGKMRPAGLREVERAQADGRWEAAYDSPASISVPEDLQAALEKNAAARGFFETLDSRNRYAILFRIQDAKRPETRARRIEQFVQMLAESKKIY